MQKVKGAFFIPCFGGFAPADISLARNGEVVSELPAGLTHYRASNWHTIKDFYSTPDQISAFDKMQMTVFWENRLSPASEIRNKT